MVEMESIGCVRLCGIFGTKLNWVYMVVWFTQNSYRALNPSAWKASKNYLMWPFLHHVLPREKNYPQYFPILYYLVSCRMTSLKNTTLVYSWSNAWDEGCISHSNNVLPTQFQKIHYSIYQALHINICYLFGFVFSIVNFDFVLYIWLYFK